LRMTTQYDTNASKRDAKYWTDGLAKYARWNQSNPLVLNYLIQKNAIWWVEFCWFRWLSCRYFIRIVIRWVKRTQLFMDEYPYFNIVSEKFGCTINPKFRIGKRQSILEIQRL
jgi:hypothetical protein